MDDESPEGTVGEAPGRVWEERPFSLYWSSISTYEECPKKFLWGHGYGTIDLGAGPGRKKPKPVKSSRHHQAMGNVLSKVLEDLYNKNLWRNTATLRAELEASVRSNFDAIVNRTYIDWSKARRMDMLQTCINGAFGYVRTMVKNRLYGPVTVSELDMVCELPGGVLIGGRPDVIIEDGGRLVIIDGKNSKDPGKYTDPDQLRWYAFCLYLDRGKVATESAFAYFRFPYGDPPEGENPDTWSGLVGIPIDVDYFPVLRDRAVFTHQAMAAGLFEATPSSSACRWCDYSTICPEYLEKKARKPTAARSGGKKADISLDGGFVPIESIVRKADD